MVRIKNKQKAPEGYKNIEPILLQFQSKLKEAESKPVKLNKSKNESLWEIYRLNHQKSRYIYDSYYKKKLINKELFNWLIKQKLVDKDLISKWRKQGYEKLCCVNCINNEKICICRVPRVELENNEKVKCVTCGCNGCSSGD